MDSQLSQMPKTPIDQPLDDAMIGEMREKFLGNFYSFAKGILGYDRFDEKIHKPICDLLQDMLFEYESQMRRIKKGQPLEDDSSLGKILIELPRSWYKSTVGSVAFPIWAATRNPNIRVLIVQNTHGNACKKLRAIRQQIEDNPYLHAFFPELKPAKRGQWTKDTLEVERTEKHPEATFEAAGTGTAVISRHYDIIVEDDTVAPDEDELTADQLAPSKQDVDQAIGFHRLTRPLFVHPRVGCNLVIGTRWFVHDLISWIKGNEKTFKVYSRAILENSRGEADEHGEPTWPDVYNRQTIDEIREAAGPYFFNTLYLNKPMTSDSQIFKPQYIMYYDKPPPDLMVFTTIDLGGDPEEQITKPDYNVVMTCGKDMARGDIYVLDYFHARCNPGKVIDAIFTQFLRWWPVKVGLEAVALQRSYLYWIRERIEKEPEISGMNLDPLTWGKKSKGTRIAGLEPLFAARNVLIRPTMKELETELLVYPLGKNDDIVDALSMQLSYWRTTPARRQIKDDTPWPANTVDFVINSIDARREVQPVGSSMDIFQKGVPDEALDPQSNATQSRIASNNKRMRRDRSGVLQLRTGSGAVATGLRGLRGGSGGSLRRHFGF